MFFRSLLSLSTCLCLFYLALWLPHVSFPFQALLLCVISICLQSLLDILLRGHVLFHGRRMLFLVIACFMVALTPHFAALPDLFSPSLAFPLAILMAMLAQAGLWGFVFLLTGMGLDALRGLPPAYTALVAHWKKGAGHGAIYGGIFMGLLLVLDVFVRLPFLGHIWAIAPLPLGFVAGVCLFPLIHTIAASADETPPFVPRLLEAYQNISTYMRGGVLGFFTAFAFLMHIPHAPGWTRFLVLSLAGMTAYAGVDMLLDGYSILRGVRHYFQSWRVYFLRALLGGVVAGALGWYLDAEQFSALFVKFHAYTDLHYANGEGGHSVGPYIIYPLFSKWGMLDLGLVGNGVKLFYLESLSGVINWSLACPLFSINFFLLSALFQRDLGPVRVLFSRKGVELLVEQAIRVLRWGLWMAPVIYSFIKMSPDPTWYNQDGAVRTLAAIFAQWALDPASFRDWSVTVFMGILAYDWLRIVIWFDHMGLRVATLVNLSFIGGDRLDAACARFIGHTGPTRCIPEGIRRFGTWAPLLIPFFIPRGPAWDTAWQGAERLRLTKALMPLPIEQVSFLYLGAGSLGVIGLLFLLQALRRKEYPFPPPCFSFSNGLISLTQFSNGCGWIQVERAARDGYEIDLTRRPLDALDVRGCFFQVHSLQALENEQPFSLTPCSLPRARALPSHIYHIEQKGENQVCYTLVQEGIRAQLDIYLHETSPIVHHKITLSEEEGRARTLHVSSFLELIGQAPDRYQRDVEYTLLHVETLFSRQHEALFARNRLLMDEERNEKKRRMSAEIFFHAFKGASGAPARLIGYQDTRAHAQEGHVRAINDEGWLAPFDPAAHLRIEVDLPALGNCTLHFQTGHGRDFGNAEYLLGRKVDIPTFQQKRRRLPPPLSSPPWPYTFQDDLAILHLTDRTPRPWAHVLANAKGYGVMVANGGEIYSFASNARHNGLTPFIFDPSPCLRSGQMVYVVDLETGDVHTPMARPLKREDTEYTVTYGLGIVTFRSHHPHLDLTLELFVPDDLPAEIRRLTFHNKGGAGRHFRILFYLDWVLNELSAFSEDHLEVDFPHPTLCLARNPHNAFHQGTAFCATDMVDVTPYKSRQQAWGKEGEGRLYPQIATHGLADLSLEEDGRRICAFSAHVRVQEGSIYCAHLVLGQAKERQEAKEMAAHLLHLTPQFETHYREIQEIWKARFAPQHVKTSDPAFDRLVNHWLPYQVYTARLWGRLGPNQRGGATGFRDQLQDVLPLLYLDPLKVRTHILHHAAQQFLEGDVLKWWHQTSDGKATGLGQRTKASDPHLWLPYICGHYIHHTKDRDILEVPVRYLEAQALAPQEQAILVTPRLSQEMTPLSEHMLRAITRSLSRLGPHGLPLMEAGDWNDGMDVMGIEGRGESVWMGFFLHAILQQWIPLVAPSHAHHFEEAAQRLRQPLEGAWQGGRYLLGFDDDGRPYTQTSLMTATWPILSGAVDFDRGLAALEGGLEHLEKEDRILLLSPPFEEDADPYPGRIAQYPQGVRENGAQYSHAATWVVDAYLRLAELAPTPTQAIYLRERAWECWYKISPIGKTEDPRLLAHYGLAPHQQPADIYEGSGQSGRGGWSLYTGSAARMLYTAYHLCQQPSK